MQKNVNTIVKNAAICFSGQARTLELCYPYIKKNLLDNLGSYDIFCCVEDDENANKTEVLKPVKFKKIKSSDVDSIIQKEVKELKRQNYRKSLFTESPRFTIRNIYQQLYKINQCFGLLEEYMKERKVGYKYFIRMRFDFLPIDILELDKFNIEKNEIIVPAERDLHSGSFNDMITIASDFDTFKTFCSCYNNFRDIVEKHLSFEMGLFKKIYFLLEKAYSNFFFFIFGNLSAKRKFFRNILGGVLMVPKHIFGRFKSNKKYYLERVLFQFMKSKEIKVRELKITFVIVRSLTDGLLIFG